MNGKIHTGPQIKLLVCLVCIGCEDTETVSCQVPMNTFRPSAKLVNWRTLETTFTNLVGNIDAHTTLHYDGTTR